MSSPIFHKELLLAPTSPRKSLFYPSFFLFSHLLTFFLFSHLLTFSLRHLPIPSLPCRTLSPIPTITIMHHCVELLPLHLQGSTSTTPLHHYCAIACIHHCELLFHNKITFPHGYLGTQNHFFVGLSGAKKIYTTKMRCLEKYTI